RNCLISPVDMRTTRVLPSACRTVPLAFSAVILAVPLIVSLVVCGLCCAAAVSDIIASTGIAHTPAKILRILIVILLSPFPPLSTSRRSPHHGLLDAAPVCDLLGNRAVQLDGTGNAARPTGLVAGANAGAVVAVEVLVE